MKLPPKASAQADLLWNNTRKSGAFLGPCRDIPCEYTCESTTFYRDLENGFAELVVKSDIKRYFLAGGPSASLCETFL